MQGQIMVDILQKLNLLLLSKPSLPQARCQDRYLHCQKAALEPACFILLEHCLPLKDTFYLSAFTVLLVTALLLITMETEVENVKNTTQGATESKEFSR